MAAIIVSGCKKSTDNASNSEGNSGDDNNNDVKVTTYTPQDITGTKAVCGGDVIVAPGLTLTEIGVCCGTNSNPEVGNCDITCTAWTWNEPFVITIHHLTPKTTYHIRAYALRGLEYYYGEEKTFTTTDLQVPTVETQYVGSIDENSATCHGEVMFGDCDILSKGFCWSTSQNPTINDQFISCGEGIGEFTGRLTGLSENTTYYVRAYATNSIGTGYGNEISFMTQIQPGVGGTIPSSVLPDELYNEVTAHFTVYTGENPPAVNGGFISKPHVLFYSTLNETGVVYNDYLFAFYGHNGLVDYYTKQWDDNYGYYYELHRDLRKIGDGVGFTCYYITDGYPNGLYAKQSTIISGRWNETYGGVVDYQVAVILLENSGNPNLAPVNSYRIIGDGDGLSIDTTWMDKSFYDNVTVSDIDLFKLFKKN